MSKQPSGGDGAMREDRVIGRIPLTTICTLNNARTPGVVCAVMVEDLDRLEARLADAERVVAAALRDQRVSRQHIALCNQLDVDEWSPEMIAVQDEMVAAAVDLDIALDEYAATHPDDGGDE